MEPSIITVSIDNEIKFKKSDLEPLKYSENDVKYSEDYRVCSISNVKYYLGIFPNGWKSDNRGEVKCNLYVNKGNATTVDINVECVIETANFTLEIKEIYNSVKGWGCTICDTTEFFNERKKYFVNNVLTLRVKGTFKINFPPRIAFPIFAQWKIKQSDLEALKTSTGESLMSKKFKIYSHSNVNYYIEIFPNGDTEEHEGTTWFFFEIVFGNGVSKIDAILNFSIESANFSFDLEYAFETFGGQGASICSTEDLFNPENRYFVDGEMTINVAGALMIEKKKAKRRTTAVNGGETSANVALQPIGEKNFTIVVKDEHIRVHKHILEAASPYFVGMFDSGMIESTKMETKITDFDYEIVAAGIKLIYNSTEIPTNFTFEQMLNLLQFTDKYDIQQIKDRIQNYLIENISPTNVCPLINFTKTIVNAPKLFTKCCEYIATCSKSSKAINGLDTIDKDLLIKIFMGTFAQTL